MTTMIQVENVAKTFTLHNQGGARLPVFDNVNFHVDSGEALVLAGASGAGKSSLLRILYGNYKPTSGAIRVTHAGRPVDIVAAVPRRSWKCLSTPALALALVKDAPKPLAQLMPSVFVRTVTARRRGISASLWRDSHRAARRRRRPRWPW